MPAEAFSFAILRAAFFSTVALFVVVVLAKRIRGHGRGMAVLAGESEEARLRWLDVVVLALLVCLAGLPYWGAAPEAGASSAGAVQVTVPQIVAATLLPFMGAVCLLLYLPVVRGVSLVAELGLARLRVSKWIGAGGLAAVTGFVAAQAVNWLVFLLVTGAAPPDETDQQAVQLFKNADQSSVRMALFVMCGLILPMTEELLYRGFIFDIARRLAGRWAGILFSAVVFSLAHQNLMAAVPLVVLGAVFAWSYERTRCLWVPMLAHALFNVWNLLMMIWGSP